MKIETLTATDSTTRSQDLVAENIERLKASFPELVTEGPTGSAVDVDVLKQLVSDCTVSDATEKYGLSWHGKRAARQLALTPSTGTLRPSPEDSVGWSTTKNLMIEGDNLEVLKLLQKSYAGKVKLIYIDPPYNTGRDFVYPDNFQDGIRNYLELTGQVEGAAKASSNTEANGRFHTDWLTMMYPRLRLARALLRDDGLLCVSIGDEEVAHLKLVLTDVFGEENYRNTIILRRYDKNLSRQFMDQGLTSLSVGFEYVLVAARGVKAALNPVFRAASEERQQTGYWKGFWNAPDRPTMRYDLLGVKPTYGQWKWKEATAAEAVVNYREYQDKHAATESLEEFWQRTGRSKKFIRRRVGGKGANQGVEHWVPPSDGVLRSSNWTDVLASSSVDTFDVPFPNPKNAEMLRLLVQLCTDEDDIVMDFFAGSGTTAVATWRQNAEDDGGRRYILVQLPEPLDSTNKDQEAAAEFCRELGKPRNIAELTKEKLRRAAATIRGENTASTGDFGFRVFKLDSSNIRAWEPDRDDVERTLRDSIEHLKSDRSEADVLYELLLKLGLDLCVPIELRRIAGKDVHAVGGGVLMACLAERIELDDVERLAQGIADWHQALSPAGPSTCVFRDSAFANDVVKTNVAAILEQHGVTNVRSL